VKETFLRFCRFSRTSCGRTDQGKPMTGVTTETTETTKPMSYLEIAQRALEARAAAMASARCSQCLALEAAGIVVLACSCGYNARGAHPDRRFGKRVAYWQARRTRHRRSGGSGHLRLVEGTRRD
jgi:hypothetical protein